MKKKIHLVMPMGGAGSRFFKDGYIMPKPLIEINGKPFFYWATRSIEKFVDIEDLTFVVLKEHIDNFKIDAAILKYFPTAKIVIIPEILPGAILTCKAGVENINDDLPIVFNDCDHCFCSKSFNDFCNSGDFDGIDGALLTFKSNDSKYSFLEVDKDDNVVRTVEKVAISDNAICGAYYFKNTKMFKKYTDEYLKKCKYSEYFVSGVYNVMAEHKNIIKYFTLDINITFGTPDEYNAAKDSADFRRFE